MPTAVLLVLLLVPRLAAARVDVTGPGPFQAGVTTLSLTKPSETTGEPRQLDTIVWYPAVDGTGAEDRLGLRDATVRKGRWPLVIFSHGSCGLPAQSVFFTTRLATWGFVVAAPPHPGNRITDGFPGCSAGPAIADSFLNRVADVRFTIDQMLAQARDPASRFSRKLNPKRIGMSGHSFGGHTTLRIAAEEPRVRAALALAPAIIAIESLRIDIPTMVQGGELDTSTPYETATLGAWAMLTGPRFLVELLAAGHFAFSDVCAGAIFGTPDCGPAAISQDEAHAFVNRFAVPFLLRYVANRKSFGRFLRPARASVAGVVYEAEPRR
jgi:predicted dienelactone hydrolase